jgi:hypothetical protein
MPSAHRRYADWTIERIRADAATIGPNTAKLTALILESRPHPEQGFRACIWILRPVRHHVAERLEAACDLGLDIGARSYGSIQSILKHGFDHLHQLGLAGMARAFAELEANPTSAALSHAEWLGLLLDREATERYERRLRARRAMPGCATRRRSKMSITVPPAASTARCFRR